ncbi:hypothetical protein ALISP_1699 [Alicycliphilus sp. B1]|nr:hypothetical protein ALISP_1699 [Alicycliphilus sp. B1]
MALIKCSECGKEISDKAATCIGCGAPVVATATSDVPAHHFHSTSSRNDAADTLDEDLRSQTAFIPRAWETVIVDNELGSYIKSAINVDTGDISLTNRRIVFCGKMGAYAKLAVFGGLAVLGAGKAPKIHFQIILKDIDKIELGKHGFAKTFIATTKEGKTYKFQVRKYDKWVAALSTAGIRVQE